MKKQFTYSTDNEHFNGGSFDSHEDAKLEALATEHKPGTTFVCVGEVAPHDNATFYPDAELIIEHMYEQARDVGGEYAEDYPDVSKEDEKLLTQMMKETLDKWCEIAQVSPSFFGVKNIKKYSVETGKLVKEK
ncbi:hypothetical protein [Vibrio splendidus]|uniref:hypothetical protein n=1 Tax=Vibrio splendidus TaxID=29497 RepID=UPI003D0CA2F5